MIFQELLLHTTQDLGGVRPLRGGQDLLLRDVRHAQEHGPTSRLRIQVPRQAGFQETYQVKAFEDPLLRKAVMVMSTEIWLMMFL